jgi:MFS family permease
MTVYCPIYLHTTIGLSWSEIGVIITVMLLPFVLIELPLGRLADKKYGEKEIMIIGFLILGLSTMGLAFITSTNVWVWAIALLVTRIGQRLLKS